jgi:hypothetical protein
LPDWPARLHAFVTEHRSTPYQWGEHDCLLFAAKAVHALTGKDHRKKYRGKYSSFASAYAYMKKLGHDSPESLLDKLFDEKPVGFAQRGDLVLASDGIPALCMGAFALSVGQEGNSEGLVRVPRRDWVKAWAV